MVRQPDPQKRAHYLNSALKLFVEKGVQNTSTAAIAREAGTAAGTLFLYFPTKQDLVDALIVEIYKEHSVYIKPGLAAASSAQEAFRAIWDGLVRWFRENLAAYQYVQQVRDTGVISERVLEESGQYLDYYFVAIQRGLDESAIKPYPMELIGEILYRDIVAVMNLIKAQPEADQQEAYIQAGFEIFWKGIKAG